MSDPTNLSPDLDRLETADSARASVRDPSTREVLTTMSELREISLDRMTALTCDWHLRRSGEGVPCDAKTVRAVYERWPWLMKQAAAFANQEANFLGESEPS